MKYLIKKWVVGAYAHILAGKGPACGIYRGKKSTITDDPGAHTICPVCQERIAENNKAQQTAVRAKKKKTNRRSKVWNPYNLALKSSDAFLASFEWRKLRMVALKKYGARCMCCGATPATGAVMNVDHIKPRKTHPDLALDIKNLQILCNVCNHGKGNWDQTDWRPQSGSIP